MIYMEAANLIIPLATEEYLNAYFSSISSALEGEKKNILNIFGKKKDTWGTRFPKVMHDLYLGELWPEEVEETLEELKVIREELKKVSVKKLVWDYFGEFKYDASKDKGNKEAKNLYEYFLTEAGQNMTDVLIARVEDALECRTGVYFATQMLATSDYEMNKERADKCMECLKKYDVELTEEEMEIFRLPYRKVNPDKENMLQMTYMYAKMQFTFYDPKSREEMLEAIAKAKEEIKNGTYLEIEE